MKDCAWLILDRESFQLSRLTPCSCHPCPGGDCLTDSSTACNINWSGTGCSCTGSGSGGRSEPEDGYKVRCRAPAGPDSVRSQSELEDVTDTCHTWPTDHHLLARGDTLQPHQVSRHVPYTCVCFLSAPTNTVPPINRNCNLYHPRPLYLCVTAATNYNRGYIIVWCWMLYVFISVVILSDHKPVFYVLFKLTQTLQLITINMNTEGLLMNYVMMILIVNYLII